MNAPQNPVILTYHSIADGRSPLKISPALFTEQMEWLSAQARVAPLTEVVAALEQQKPLPKRTVVLTFDDGFLDFYSVAALVLRRCGFPATVFLPTAYCGRTNAWPGQPAWVDEQPLMDWTQIRQLAEEGISFGAHSATHVLLTQLPQEDVEREIVESRGEIEARAGRRPEFFCYPYGRWNCGVREIVMRHFRGACTTAAGVVGPEADPFALPRADVHDLRRAVCFRSLFTGRLQTYLMARRLIRRLRSQPEGYLSAR